MDLQLVSKLATDLVEDVYRFPPSVNIAALAQHFGRSPKYRVLMKIHQPIYRAILKREVTHKNLHILKKLLKEGDKAKKNKISLEKAGTNVQAILEKECDVPEITENAVIPRKSTKKKK